MYFFIMCKTYTMTQIKNSLIMQKMTEISKKAEIQQHRNMFSNNKNVICD